MVIAVGIFAVGADRLVEIFQGPYGVLQVQVGCAAADVGVGYLVFLEDEFVEILDRLLVLLVLQARIAPAVIGVRQVGSQVDRLAEVLQRVVVVAHARTGQRPVDVGGREHGVFDDGSRKVGIGTQQVVEVEFGYTPQEIALCGVRIGPQQDVEHTNRLLIFAVHQAAAAGPVEVVFVVLGVGCGGVAQQRPHATTPRFGCDYSCSYPKRLSCRSLSRQFSFTLTYSSRKTFLPRNCSMSSRACCPTFLSFSPLCPIRIPFWESRAT